MSKTPKRNPAWRLRDLLWQQAKWTRRETIAYNKLKKIRARLDALATEVIHPPPDPNKLSGIHSGRKIVK